MFVLSRVYTRLTCLFVFFLQLRRQLPTREMSGESTALRKYLQRTLYTFLSSKSGMCVLMLGVVLCVFSILQIVHVLVSGHYEWQGKCRCAVRPLVCRRALSAWRRSLARSPVLRAVCAAVGALPRAFFFFFLQRTNKATLTSTTCRAPTRTSTLAVSAQLTLSTLGSMALIRVK